MLKIVLVIAVTVILSDCAPGQVTQGDLHAQFARVSQALEATGFAGGKFEICALIDADNALCQGCIRTTRFDMGDPSFKGCYIFVARGVDSTGVGSLEKRVKPFGDSLDVLGIYRGGQIVWMSAPMRGEYLQGSFFAVTDLNSDGKPEIVIRWAGYDWRALGDTWIFGWDGTSGSVVNDTAYGGTKLGEMFKFLDVDGDGVEELLGMEEGADGTQMVVYSWNGIKYGKWASTPSLAGKNFTAANNFIPGLSTIVRQAKGRLSFHYTLSADQSSKQSIKSLNLPNLTDSADGSVPKGWTLGIIQGGRFLEFVADSSQYYVKPGASQTNLVVSGIGLPRIVTFYAQAQFSGLNPTQLSLDNLQQDLLTNILGNSARGLTIGPAIPDSPFVTVQFLDTISGFLTRSRTLGWFTNRPDTAKPLAGELATDSIMTRLTKRLTRVRNALVANDSATARTELTRFINKVQSLYKETNDGDQAPGEIVLTSEAYALLKFNAQFLLAKIAQ